MLYNIQTYLLIGVFLQKTSYFSCGFLTRLALSGVAIGGSSGAPEPQESGLQYHSNREPEGPPCFQAKYTKYTIFGKKLKEFVQIRRDEGRKRSHFEILATLSISGVPKMLNVPELNFGEITYCQFNQWEYSVPKQQQLKILK